MNREKLSDDVRWDGITQAKSLIEEAVQTRHALADAAKGADWSRVFKLLSEDRQWANSVRLDGSSWFAPLHQAAWHGAPVASSAATDPFGGLADSPECPGRASR